MRDCSQAEIDQLGQFANDFLDEAEAVMVRREETGRKNDSCFSKRVRQEDENVVGSFVAPYAGAASSSK